MSRIAGTALALAVLFLKTAVATGAEPSPTVVPSVVTSTPFGPERPVSSANNGPAAGLQISPAIASSKGDFLLVWADQRSNPRSGDDLDIYGARLDEEGRLLDPTGFPISRLAGVREDFPTTAWDGRAYLVAWSATARGENAAATSGIYFRRLEADFTGAFPEAARILPAVPNSESRPLLSSNGRGTTLLLNVAFSEAGSTFATYRLDRNGSDVTPAFLFSGPTQGMPGIANDGNNFVIVRFSGTQLIASRISGSGTFIDSRTVASVSTSDGRNPSIAWNGTEYLVTFGIEGKLFAQRLTVSADPIGGVIQLATGFDEYALAPTVAWSGDVWTIAAAVQSGIVPCPVCQLIFDLHTLRVLRDGTVIGDIVRAQRYVTGIDAPPIPIVSGTNTVTFAWGGEDILASQINPDGSYVQGSAFNGRLISQSARAEERPQVVWGGSTFMVTSHDPDRDRFFGSILTPGGEILRENVILPGSAAASNGIRFLVVGSEGSRGRARFFSGNGIPDGPLFDLPLTGTSRSIAVSSDGTDFLVAWASQEGVRSVRISSSGAVDPVVTTISTANASSGGLQAISTGTEYLLVWSEEGPNCNVVGCGANIRAARLNRSNLLLGPGPFFVSRAADDQREPSVAWSGVNYLVVWTSPRTDPSDIRGTRVSREGVILDGTSDGDGAPLGQRAGEQRRPAAAFNGSSFFVVWETRPAATQASDLAGHAYQVSSPLNLSEGEPDFVASAEPGDEREPDMTSGYGGQLALTYGRTPELGPQIGVPRVFVRLAAPVPFTRPRVTRRR